MGTSRVITIPQVIAQSGSVMMIRFLALANHLDWISPDMSASRKW